VGGIGGVGAAADVTLIRNTVAAYIGQNAYVLAERDKFAGIPAGNIEVLAESHKQAASIVMAASGGGAAGIGGATAIIAIGSVLNSDSRTSLGQALNFIKNVLSTDLVKDKMGNSSHVRDMENSLSTKVTGLGVLVDDFLNDLATESLSKTRAYIGAGAEIQAENDITVKAEDYTAVTVLAGGDGLGTVGAGGGIGIAVIYTTTEAFAETDAVLSANHNISIQALVKDQEKDGTSLELSVAAFGGSAGLVGLGAAVAYLDVENTVRAALNGAQALYADNLLVWATAANNLKAEALGASAGGGAVGASLARAKHTGIMEAALTDNSSTFDIGALEVKALWQTTAAATARAGALGIGSAGNGAAASTQVDPTVKAYFGNDININTTGNILILAQSLIDSSTLAQGVSISLGYSGGVSSAVTEISPTNSAYIGGGTVNAGGSITLQALHNMNTGGAIVDYTARADSITPAGGLFGGVGARAEAVSNGDAEAYLGSDAEITAGSAVILQSLNYNKAAAEAKGITGGLAALGAVLADATAGGTTRSYVSGKINSAGALQVRAQGYALSSADCTAAAGGIASGSANHAKAVSSPVVVSYLGDGTEVKVIKVTGTTGNVELYAQSIASATAVSRGVNAGTAAIGVSWAEAYITPVVAAYMGNQVTVNADNDIIIIAAHNYNLNGVKRGEKADAFANAGSGGSLIGATGANVLAKHSADVQTYIGNNVSVSAGRDITLKAYGNLNAQAEGNGYSAGVVGIGGVVVKAETNGSVLAYLAPGIVTAGRDLLVTALGSATPNANSQQAAGGIVSGGGSAAESISDLNVRVFLGKNPISGLPGGTYSAQTGSISGLAKAEGGSTANSVGINVSGISVGLSSAKAQWEATVELIVGGNAVLTAGTDLNLQAEQQSTSSSYASSSTGNLVGGTGSKGDTETTSSAIVYLEDSTSLTAGCDVVILARSESITDAEASGQALGLGASGITIVENTLDNTARAQAGSGVRVQAGRNLDFKADAVSNARKAKAESGSANIVGDAMIKATINLNHLSETILGSDAQFHAGNTNQILAQSSLDAHGWSGLDTFAGVQVNKTETQVTVNAITRTILHSGAQVSGKDTYVLAKVTRLQVSAESSSLTNAADSESVAVTGLSINSLAQVMVQGAATEAQNRLEIRATHANVKTSSNAYGEIKSGFTGSITTSASNNLAVRSKLDIQAGSELHAADIWLEALSPHEAGGATGIYQLDAFAKAETVVNYVLKEVEELYYETREVVEEVTEWLPWPLGEVVRWVTKTIVEPAYRTVYKWVPEVVNSALEMNTSGNYVNESAINLQGDVYLGNARGIKLVIDENGQISAEGGVSATISGSQIVVNDVINDQLGHLTINTPFGELTGNAVIHKNTVVGLFEIINHSDLDLTINNIILVNNNAGQDQDVAIYVKDEKDSSQFIIGISKTPQVSIVSTKAGSDIAIGGVIQNPTGKVSISAGGSIYSLNGSAIQANILELAAGAQIGQDADHRLIVEMYKQTFLVHPVFSLTAGGDAYLEVLLLENRRPGDSPPLPVIERLQISRIETGGLLDFYAPQSQMNMSDYDGVYGVGEIISQGEVRIRLDSGYLWDYGDISKPNIAANKAFIYAKGDIGDLSSQPLRTRINYLEATSEQGHIYVRDSGNLTIGGVSSEQGISAYRQVNIEAESIIVTESIVSQIYDDTNNIFLKAGYLELQDNALIRSNGKITLSTAASGGTFEIRGSIETIHPYYFFIIGGDGNDIIRLYSGDYKKINNLFTIDGGGGQDTVETFCYTSSFIQIFDDKIYFSNWECFSPENLERVELHGLGGKVEFSVLENTILNKNPDIEYVFHGSDSVDIFYLYYNGSSSNLSPVLSGSKMTGLDGIVAKSLEFTNVEVLEISFGSGNDTLTVNNPVSGVSIKVFGGGGSNTLDLSGYTTALDIKLTGPGDQSGFNGQTNDASITFTNISILRGSDAVGVNDSLTGMDVDSVFRLGDGAPASIITGGEYIGGGHTLTFQGFEVLTGGSAQDTFEIFGLAEFTLLNGGGGNDSFNIAAGSVFNGDIDGGPGNDSFIFSIWSLSGGNIAGGLGDDSFIFQGNGEWLGDIDGGPGSNSLDYSASTLNLKLVLAELGDSAGFNGSITVWTIFEDQELNSELGDFRNIAVLRGNPAIQASLTGLDAGGIFTLDNSGDRYTSGGRNLDFSGFAVLIGGSGDDTFNIQRDIAHALRGGDGDDTFAFFDFSIWLLPGGSIDGGAGSNWLDYSNFRHLGNPIPVIVNLLEGIIQNKTPDATVTNIQNIIGSQADDTLIGNDMNNIIYGMGGDDIIKGMGGNNILVGGDGDDLLYGGKGTDIFIFEDNWGHDTLYDYEPQSGESASEGSYVLDFSAVTSNLTIALNSSLAQNPEPSLKVNDTLNGLPHNLLTYAGTFSGSFTAVYGGRGNDTFILNEQRTASLYGGEGDDTYCFADGVSYDGLLDGQEGSNTLDFSAYTTVVNVTLTGLGSAGGFDGLANSLLYGFNNISRLVGGSVSAEDSLTGLDADSIFRLGAGLDPTGGEYESGTVILTFSGFETLSGGSGNDTFEILGEVSFTLLDGGAGDDAFCFRNGSAVTGDLDGGPGSNTLDYSDYLTDVRIDLAEGTATSVTGGISNIQKVIGGKGNDILIGNDQDNTLDGGPGDDSLSAGGGFNILIGGEGKDSAIITYPYTYSDPKKDIEHWVFTSFSEGSSAGSKGSEQIDSSIGGTVTYEGVKVEILPDVLPESTTLSIKKLSGEEILTNIPDGFTLRLASDIYQITTSGPRYFGENNFINIKIPYDPAKIGPGERPVMHYYDEEQEKWVEIDTDIEYDDKTGTWYAVVKVNHLTDFAVFGVKWRPYLQDRFLTAVAISQTGWQTSDYAVLVRGDNFADALSAAPLAHRYGGPVLLTKPDKISAETLAELKRLGVKQIFIVGGPAAVSPSIDAELKARGIAVERIYGIDRYETAVKVAEKLGSVQSVFLATGTDFPDAVAASAVAAKLSIPILLTNKDNLPASIEKYLKDHPVKQSYILGGISVISTAIEKVLPAAVRLAGKDRYETNLAILKHFADSLDWESIYLATGNVFADGLTGGVLAAKTSSPLILTGQTLSADITDYLKTRLLSSGKVWGLGGEKAVPEAVLFDLEALIP